MVGRAHSQPAVTQRHRVPAVARHTSAFALGLLVLLVGVSPAAGATLAGATVTPRPSLRSPTSMNLYFGDVFRYQDPNPYACTSTSAMDMLNIMSVRGSGGRGFRWRVTLSDTARDQILAWERANDTLEGGSGSDPHGWRNALNYYGWGAASLTSASRVYDDFSFDAYDTAMKAAVRALAGTRKPVGLAAWRGGHAQMVTGYYGLRGNPFAQDSRGRFTNAFTVAGFYISDPLRSDGIRNLSVSWTTLRDTTNYQLRFQRYYETDSPYDDPYTSGTIAARDEWYGKFVLVLPVR